MTVDKRNNGIADWSETIDSREAASVDSQEAGSWTVEKWNSGIVIIRTMVVLEYEQCDVEQWNVVEYNSDHWNLKLWNSGISRKWNTDVA